MVLAAAALVAIAVPVARSCALDDDARCDPECSAERGDQTCRDYALDTAVWPVDAGGRAVVRYRVDPDVPAGQDVTGEELVAAVQTAAAVWEAADPVLDLVYEGTTDRSADVEDGVSVVGFGDGTEQDAVAYATVFRTGEDAEVDVLLMVEGIRYVAQPCEQADGSCVPVEHDDAVVDLHSVLTHELGHLLGLDHPDAAADDLTMSPEWVDDERFPQTLALGDVLGVRALYPCDCPLPAVLSP